MILLLIAVVFFLPLQIAQGQEYSVTESVVLPSEFYVGDRAEIRIRVQTQAGVELSSPAALPQSAWADFHELGIFPIDTQRSEIRLTFTSFRPGTQTIPPIDLGGIVLSGQTVHVNSVLDDTVTELSLPEAPLLLPTTRLRIAAFVALLVLGPGVLWFGFGFSRVQARALVESYRSAQPYRRLRKALRRLDEEIEQLDARSFYIVLLEDLRRYLSRRLDRELMSATSLEIIHVLNKFDPRGAESLAQIFRTGDLVKFAGRTVELEQRRAHLASVQQVASMIESWRRQAKERSSSRRIRRMDRRSSQRVGV